jgi:hypothetical protein
MACVDAFHAVIVAFLRTTPLVQLMRKVAAPKALPTDAH